MFAWLRRLTRGPAVAALDLRNEAVGLAMDWGEQWLAPIQGRLAEKYPRLPRAELDALDATAREVMQQAQATILESASHSDQGLTQEAFTAQLLPLHPWLNAENMERLFRQATYYTWKFGGPAGRHQR